MISDLASAGALPVLGMALTFAGRRQALIANNIANFDTPDYRPMDVRPSTFRSQLADAVDRRRRTTGGTHGRVEISRGRELWQSPNGNLNLRPRTPTGNILFHDRNNRDLERTMQDLVENAGMHRLAGSLMRTRMSTLRNAISERPG